MSAFIGGLTIGALIGGLLAAAAALRLERWVFLEQPNRYPR